MAILSLPATRGARHTGGGECFRGGASSSGSHDYPLLKLQGTKQDELLLRGLWSRDVPIVRGAHPCNVLLQFARCWEGIRHLHKSKNVVTESTFVLVTGRRHRMYHDKGHEF